MLARLIVVAIFAVVLSLAAGQAAPQEKPAQPAAPEAKAVQDRWDDLKSSNAGQAYKAIWALAATPKEALPLLDKNLQPVKPADGQQITSWINDLDSTQFAVRQKATDALAKLGEVIEPALKKALEDKPSLEKRQRLTQLMARMSDWPPDQLQVLRAIEVLEKIGTPDARKLLDKLAGGAPESRLTQEAKLSLERLAKKPADKP